MSNQPNKDLKQRIINRYDGNTASNFAKAVGFEKTTIIAPAIKKAFNSVVRDSQFDIEKDKVIDIGCGPFMLALPFLRDGIHVDGVDITPGMIKEAQQTLLHARIHPGVNRSEIDLVTDYARLAPESYKFAMLNFVHQCCDTKKSLVDLFTQASDLLQPGGRLLMITTHPDYLYVPHAAYACDVDRTQILRDGDIITGTIYNDLGRAAFEIEDDHYWSRGTILRAAIRAGFEVRNIEDIDDHDSIARVKSHEPAYLMFSFSKPQASPAP